MKCNYKIYKNYSGEMPEDNTQFTEQKILAQVKKQLEESKRIVLRPKVKVWKDALLLFGVVVLIAAVLITLRLFTDISSGVFALICIATGLIYLAVNGLVIENDILKKYAPETVHSSCLFEPCCSEYMRISVLKYGALKGLIRGIKRISRCRYPNGGIDEP